VPKSESVVDRATGVHSLKVLTINVHKGFTFFKRRFILPELRDAVRTTGADLVFLQEVHGTHERHAMRYPGWPPTSQYEFLADSMWPEFAYGRNAVYADGDHGNALLSKFPIREYNNLDASIQGNEQRGLLHCVIDVPGHAYVHAICVHLGLREAHRRRQIDLLAKQLAKLAASAIVIVAGDFNDWRGRADAQIAGLSLVEAFTQTCGAPARSFPAWWPIFRLDRIYLRNATPQATQVLTSRPWSHLSDHAPLIAQVSL